MGPRKWIWELGAGVWEKELGSWKLGARTWELDITSHHITGDWKLETGSWDVMGWDVLWELGAGNWGDWELGSWELEELGAGM